jgi:hypothetical protein
MNFNHKHIIIAMICNTISLTLIIINHNNFINLYKSIK